MILDTHALSAVADDKPEVDDEPEVVKVYRQAASMELPAIVLGEYRLGIGQSRRRSEYERWLRDLIGVTRVLARRGLTNLAHEPNMPSCDMSSHRLTSPVSSL